jgi:hypothetical protein
LLTFANIAIILLTIKQKFANGPAMTTRRIGAGEGTTGYEVGYGRPPLHTRFKPGQSGNPRGRPSGQKSVVRLLLEALAERAVVVGADGKRRKVAKHKLGVARLADRFAEGDPNATRIVLDLLWQVERRTPSEPAERPPLAAADALVIDNLLARLKAP